MRAVLAVGLAVALLAACAPQPAPEPIVRTVEVHIPVPTPCDPDIGPEPVFADSTEALAAAPDIFEAMKLRVVGRLQRIAWAGVLTAALDGCGGRSVEPAQP